MTVISSTLGLKSLILQKYSELSPQERKIADHIIQNHQTVIVLTARELAAKTGVSEPTVVRFSKRLGFGSFPDFKSRLIEEVREKIMPEDRFKLLPRDKNHVSTVLKVAQQEVKNINRTIDTIDAEQLAKFIGLLSRSSYVYTFGIGISSLLARFAAYQFNQAGLRAVALLKEEHSILERLVNLDSTEVLMGLSFPPYSKETIEAMKFCRERNTRCLAITDRPTAPIVKCADAYLLVKSDNLLFTNAISAIVVVINALATDLAFANKDKAADNSKLVRNLVKDEYCP